MEVRISDTYEEMSATAADFIAALVRNKPQSLLCLPSGDTPTRSLQLLVDMVRSGKLDLSQCRFVGLDEWVGMDKTMKGSCQHYIYDNFFNPLKIAEERITLFNARAADLDQECKRIDQFIFSNGRIDLALVGVGVNGHIGLNEPGTSHDLYSHHVALEETTKKVAQKYFNESKTLSRGITLGLKHILESKTIVVVANGEKKTDIIKKIINGPITEHVPGSVLQKHDNCYFFLDQAAGALITT